MCCLPGMDAMAKYLSQSMPVMQVIWFRYLGQFLVVLCILSSNLRASAETDNLGIQLLRSGSLFGTTVCFFFALKFIDQGQAAATFQVAPLIISLLAMLFLGERLGIKKCFGILLGFTGAIIIVQPQQFHFSAFALLPILAATFMQFTLCSPGHLERVMMLGQHSFIRRLLEHLRLVLSYLLYG